MFLNQSDVNSFLNISEHDQVDWIESVNRPELIAFTSGIGEHFTIFFVNVCNTELEYPEQTWELESGGKRIQKTANMMVLVNNNNVVNCFSGDQHIIQDYNSDISIDIANFESIMDSIHSDVYKDQDDTPSDSEGDQDEESQDGKEHQDGVNITGTSEIEKMMKDINSQISNLTQELTNHQSALKGFIDGLHLKENININTNVESAGLNTVLKSIDNAIINLNDSLSDVKNAIKEANQTVETTSSAQSDNINLAFSKLENASNILREQFNASVSLNSAIQHNIDNVSNTYHQMIAKINQNQANFEKNLSRLLIDTEEKFNGISTLINDSISNDNLVANKVSDNTEVMLTSVNDVKKVCNSLQTKLQDYDNNICAKFLAEKEFREKCLVVVKNIASILITSFWICFFIIIIKEVVL